ncbi:hypothetical protein E8L99_04995 [Phreatobacter aquaticus]|uniref:Uncharacterized protein n=1 Tax=Phreatobacter aquaticus TaxID=2570229 RepID=A0A4D7QF01_9HYPH|nr:hypothetical protein [Phreatobacter aquaticus]QCK85181.1 hypothetical protein E8L99_04995 [Phreatobacter aquaticus]
MTTLPHGFHKIRLNLARSKDFPDGSSRHGYEFVAPLTADAHIDLARWKEHKALCKVRRFWVGEEDQHGLVVHKPGGAKGATWVFDYDGAATVDDEAGYRFGEHPFQLGEYVSIRDEDGEMHTFVVTSTDAV